MIENDFLHSDIVNIVVVKNIEEEKEGRWNKLHTDNSDKVIKDIESVIKDNIVNIKFENRKHSFLFCERTGKITAKILGGKNRERETSRTKGSKLQSKIAQR